MVPDHDNIPFEISKSAWVGIDYFNRELYFDAHEHLEIAWRNESKVIRSLYQGILQAGICIYHARRGNLTGALKVGERAIRHLDGWKFYKNPLDISCLYKDLLQILFILKNLQQEDQHIPGTFSKLFIKIRP